MHLGGVKSQAEEKPERAVALKQQQNSSFVGFWGLEVLLVHLLKLVNSKLKRRDNLQRELFN